VPIRSAQNLPLNALKPVYTKAIPNTELRKRDRNRHCKLVLGRSLCVWDD